MLHTHPLTILYADQQSIHKVPQIWGQLNEKGNGSSPDPFLARLRRALRKKVWLARLPTVYISKIIIPKTIDHGQFSKD